MKSEKKYISANIAPYIFASFFMLTSGMPLTVNAERALEPTVPATMKAQCIFVENCIAGERYKSGKNCQDERLKLGFWIDGSTGSATVTRPNGSQTTGTALEYRKYEDLPYVVVSTSDGSGSSMLTLLPNHDAIWTAHFTLARNVAYNHFGTCEVID